MKFLEKLGIGKKKKKEENEEVVAVAAKPNRLTRLVGVLSKLNKPMGGGNNLGFNPTPQRTMHERQLGIPEYINPRDRAKDFSSTPKPIPKPKKVITNWRPTPGKVSRKGEEVRW